MRRPPSSKRLGVVLLDVLCALTVLAVAGAALVGHVSRVLRIDRMAGGAEETTLRMDQLLRVHRLLTGAELRSRIGERRYGDLRVRVRPLEQGLFEVAVLTAGAARPALITIMLADGDER